MIRNSWGGDNTCLNGVLKICLQINHSLNREVTSNIRSKLFSFFKKKKSIKRSPFYGFFFTFMPLMFNYTTRWRHNPPVPHTRCNKNGFLFLMSVITEFLFIFVCYRFPPKKNNEMIGHIVFMTLYAMNPFYRRTPEVCGCLETTKG